MSECVETFINVSCDILYHWPVENITSLDLINRVLANNTLLEVVANRTFLSAEYINICMNSAIQRRDRNNESAGDGLDLTKFTNSTCEADEAMSEMILTTFFPAILILLILTVVNKRMWRRNCCGGRPGLVIPVNLLDSYEDRYCYGFAFGATASQIVTVIVNGNYASVFGKELATEIKTYPSYVSAIMRIIAAIIIGVSYYPFFACISTRQRLLGSVLGSLYSVGWFLAYIFDLLKCGVKPSNGLTVAENILNQAPSLICHGFLLACFVIILIRSFISKKRGIVISDEEWKENYKYQYVKKLLKHIPKSEQTVVTVNGFKQKVVSSLYRWRPDFKYSTRVVCISLTGCVCLYLVLIYFIAYGRYLKSVGKSIIDSLEIDTKMTSEEGINWSLVKEGIDVAFVCWIVASGIACVKDLVLMANMVSWYRGHALRLQRGDRSFLPESIVNKAPTDLMVASFKFAGYQVGYIVWGFIVTHLVLFLIACVFAFGLIWPLTWGTVEDSIILYLLLSLWPTLVISLLTVLAQKLMAKYIFLRDFGATLALNNRRLFHIVSYFLYFLNIFIGLFSCLIRIIYAMLVGVVFLPRLQKSALPRDWEIWDPGFNTYLGYLVLEHTHTNPVLCTFSQLVLDAIAQKERGGREVGSLKYIISRKARNRWLLTVTLINNPELRDLRKPEVYEKNVFLALKNTAVLGWKIGELDQYAETKF